MDTSNTTLIWVDPRLWYEHIWQVNFSCEHKIWSKRLINILLVINQSKVPCRTYFPPVLLGKVWQLKLVFNPDQLMKSTILLEERICDGFHVIGRTDEDYRCSSANCQSKFSCVVCDFKWIIWIWKNKINECKFQERKYYKKKKFP